MLKKKNLLNKKIVFNKVASKFRNYISEPLITFSKTAISASFLDSYLTKNNNNTTINNNFFINNSQVNIDNKNHDSLDKIKKKLGPYNKQNLILSLMIQVIKIKRELLPTIRINLKVNII